MLDIHSRFRTDWNPREDLPVMIVVGSEAKAMALQRILHPREFIVRTLNEGKLGYWARAVFVITSDLIETSMDYYSDVLTQWREDKIEEFRLALPPECAKYFFKL